MSRIIDRKWKAEELSEFYMREAARHAGLIPIGDNDDAQCLVGEIERHIIAAQELLADLLVELE